MNYTFRHKIYWLKQCSIIQLNNSTGIAYEHICTTKRMIPPKHLKNVRCVSCKVIFKFYQHGQIKVQTRILCHLHRFITMIFCIALATSTIILDIIVKAFTLWILVDSILRRCQSRNWCKINEYVNINYTCVFVDILFTCLLNPNTWEDNGYIKRDNGYSTQYCVKTGWIKNSFIALSKCHTNLEIHKHDVKV